MYDHSRGHSTCRRSRVARVYPRVNRVYFFRSEQEPQACGVRPTRQPSPCDCVRPGVEEKGGGPQMRRVRLRASHLTRILT